MAVGQQKRMFCPNGAVSDQNVATRLCLIKCGTGYVLNTGFSEVKLARVFKLIQPDLNAERYKMHLVSSIVTGILYQRVISAPSSPTGRFLGTNIAPNIRHR